MKKKDNIKRTRKGNYQVRLAEDTWQALWNAFAQIGFRASFLKKSPWEIALYHRVYWQLEQRPPGKALTFDLIGFLYLFQEDVMELIDTPTQILLNELMEPYRKTNSTRHEDYTQTINGAAIPSTA